MSEKIEKIEKKVITKPKAPAKPKNALSMKMLLEKLEAQSLAIENLEQQLKEDRLEVISLKKENIEAYPDTEEEQEKMRLKDRELVVGTFRFNDVKGGHIKLIFHKWPGDPVEQFLLVDGYRYAIPRGLAKHLRDSGKLKGNPGVTDLREKSMRRPRIIHNRYSFERDDFEEAEDINNISKGYAPKNTGY